MGFSRQEYWSGVPLPTPISLPRVSYFLVVSPEDCRGNIVVGLDGSQERSMKQEGRGRAQLLKEVRAKLL